MRKLGLLTVMIGSVAFLLTSGCVHQEEKKEGRHIKVRAPFTRVDVYTDEDEGADVEVDVDD